MPFDAGTKGEGFLADNTNVYLSPEEVHKASLVVIEHAIDKEDQIYILTMLGLIKEKT